ncbi:DNA methyltransferase [Ruminococcus sp.]|uniref:TRM11 family SAM-dependent methyltransferase n=1 Tax=Ruminococcus sp. TaxID=41978 RepID=UPI003F81427C
MGKINDLDMSKWKELTDVWTDSLWIIPQRDNSGAHDGHYHGNFVPQIPHQLLMRYTKAGDFVLDPFAGSGTTLIEAQRMGRNSIGIELQPSVAAEAINRIHSESKDGIVADTFVDDSRVFDTRRILDTYKIDNVQFIIYHPPYWDIIKFSEDENDLSNSETLNEFIDNFRQVVRNTSAILEKGRYCAVVIGDKYANSQLVPLGFHCMQAMQQEGLTLKATIVKNFEETKGKANQKALWRQRALQNGLYLFKHEYIFVFKKEK